MNDIIIRTVDFIEDHLNERITLEEVAQQMNYSKFHLNRVFSEAVGCTIYKYIQVRRLTEAARMLVQTDRSIIEIADLSGYDTQQAFTAAFRQQYQEPPMAYRKRCDFSPVRERYPKAFGGICNINRRAA